MAQKIGDNMSITSKEIIKALPTLSDKDLKILRGQLCLNWYGPTISDQCKNLVIEEDNRRRLEQTNK